MRAAARTIEIPPVGPQHHPGAERLAACGAQQRCRAGRLQPRRLVGQERHAKIAGTPFQRRRQDADRDVPAEGLVADFASVEDHRGRHQTRRIVDELEAPQRRRLLHDVARPRAEMGQQPDRGLHQGNRARVVLGHPRTAGKERHRQPRLGHEATRRQPRGAGAHHHDICTLNHQFSPATAPNGIGLSPAARLVGLIQRSRSEFDADAGTTTKEDA
jgi:hypothetical protein